MPIPAPHRRVLVASFLGTTIEFYDFYVYATAASLVFGALFFPAQSPGTQLLAAFATLGIAFFARPVGGIVFGHFGDRIGRKSTLVASLLTMGLSTTLIAALPTHAAIGWWAPLMLCVLRFGQGFGLGGEWGGAALLAVEYAPPGRRARYASAPQLGAPAGFILANGLFLLIGLALTPDQFRDWGWRVPFALSALLVFVGLWVRLRLDETPAFAAAMRDAPPVRLPLTELIRGHWQAVLLGTMGAIACFGLYYVETAFVLGYATQTLGYAKEQILVAQLGAILFMAVGIYAAAWLSDRRFSERRVLATGCAGVVVAGVLIEPMMTSGSLGIIFAYLAVTLLLMGFVYGPLSAWLPSLLPAKVRYTGASLAFNLAAVLGGGLTPFVAQGLAVTHGLGSVGLYASGLAALSLVAFLIAPARQAAIQERAALATDMV